jgi:hypothetical protein
MEEPPFCCPSPQALLIGVVVLPVAGLVSALRRTPLHERYALRARRHLERDPQQALADFGQALDLAPDRARTQLLKERAALHEALGMEEASIRDLLSYSAADGAYEDETGAGLMKAIGGDALEGYVQAARNSERRRLVKEGRVTAVGYCRACREVVELDTDLRCSISSSHPKPRRVQFAMPGETEQAIQVVTAELKEGSRGRRTCLIVVAALAGLLLLVCIAFALLSQKQAP